MRELNMFKTRTRGKRSKCEEETEVSFILLILKNLCINNDASKKKVSARSLTGSSSLCNRMLEEGEDEEEDGDEEEVALGRFGGD